MDTLEKLIKISNKLDLLDNNAVWIVNETEQTDLSISSTAALISNIADDLREHISSLVYELESKSDFVSKSENQNDFH